MLVTYTDRVLAGQVGVTVPAGQWSDVNSNLGSWNPVSAQLKEQATEEVDYEQQLNAVDLFAAVCTAPKMAMAANACADVQQLPFDITFLAGSHLPRAPRGAYLCSISLTCESATANMA